MYYQILILNFLMNYHLILDHFGNMKIMHVSQKDGFKKNGMLLDVDVPEPFLFPKALTLSFEIIQVF